MAVGRNSQTKLACNLTESSSFVGVRQTSQLHKPNPGLLIILVVLCCENCCCSFNDLQEHGRHSASEQWLILLIRQ